MTLSSTINQSTIQKQIEEMDIDGDGNIGEAELEEFAKKFIREKKQSKRTGRWLYIALGTIILLAASNIATGYLAVNLSKDIKIVGDNIKPSGSAETAAVLSITDTLDADNADDAEPSSNTGSRRSARELIEASQLSKKMCLKGLYQSRKEISEHKYQYAIKAASLDRRTHYFEGPKLLMNDIIRFTRDIAKDSAETVTIKQDCRDRFDTGDLKEDWKEEKKKKKEAEENGETYFSKYIYDDEVDDGFFFEVKDDKNDYDGFQHATIHYEKYTSKKTNAEIKKGEGHDMHYIFYAERTGSLSRNNLSDVLHLFCKDAHTNERGDKGVYCETNIFVRLDDNLKYYDTKDDLDDTHKAAYKFCNGKGKLLPTYEDLCPNGKHSYFAAKQYPRLRDSWVAIISPESSSPNRWINMNADDTDSNGNCKYKRENNLNNDATVNEMVFCGGEC